MKDKTTLINVLLHLSDFLDASAALNKAQAEKLEAIANALEEGTPLTEDQVAETEKVIDAAQEKEAAVDAAAEKKAAAAAKRKATAAAKKKAATEAAEAAVHAEADARAENEDDDEVDLEKAQEAAVAFMHATDVIKTRAILAKWKVRKVSEADEEHYPAIHAAFVEALADVA